MNIIITGGSSGIGKDLFSLFAEDPKNRVFSFGRSEPAVESMTPNMHYLRFDLRNYQTDRISLLDAVDSFFENQGIDILINNAGWLKHESFESVTHQDLLDTFHINFFSVFSLLQDIKPKLGLKGISHILNIGSMGGFQGSVKFAGLSVYSASKAALANLTECLAAEWTDENIKVNCLALGSVDTAMLRKAFPGYQAPIGSQEMARFIADFALNGHRFFNGKVIPVASTTP